MDMVDSIKYSELPEKDVIPVCCARLKTGEYDGNDLMIARLRLQSQAKEIEGLRELVRLAVQWFGDEIENGNGNIEYDELELTYKKLLTKPTEPDAPYKGMNELFPDRMFIDENTGDVGFSTKPTEPDTDKGGE